MDMKIFVDTGLWLFSLLEICAYPCHGVCLTTKYMLKLFCNFNRLFIFLTNLWSLCISVVLWLHADADIRLARRIRRDTVERGRDVTSVLEQVFKHCILLTNLCYLQTLQISLRYHACIDMTLIRVSIEIISMLDLSSLHLMLLSCLRRNMLMWSYQKGEITMLQLI
jgi:hypothetical protein